MPLSETAKVTVPPSPPFRHARARAPGTTTGVKALDPESARPIERCAAGRDGGGPAGGRAEAAEGEEVRRDVAEPARRACGGERADDGIGRGGAEQMLGEPGIAGERMR